MRQRAYTKVKRPRSAPTGVTAVIIVAVAFGAGCTSQTPRELENSWQVDTIVSESFSGSPTMAVTMTLAGGEGNGFSGCNTYSFRYELAEESITISGLYGTRLACKDPGVMETERAFLDSISTATIWSIDGGALSFVSDATTVVFSPPTD
jgi:heat shock protein HslJ